MEDAMALLRMADVLRMRPEGRSSWLVAVRDGVLPPPVKIGPRLNGWPRFEVDLVNRMDLAASRMPEREFRDWCEVTAKRLAEVEGLPVGAWYWRRVDYQARLMAARRQRSATEYSYARPAMTAIE